MNLVIGEHSSFSSINDDYLFQSTLKFKSYQIVTVNYTN